MFAVSLFLLNGCFVPEKFQSKIDIKKDGSYTMSYDGTIVHANALERKPSPKDEKKLAALVKRMKKDPSVKEVKYLGAGKYHIVTKEDKKSGRRGSIMDFIVIRPKGKTINIVTKKMKPRDLKELQKLNAKIDGKFTVSIPDNMKLEGTKPNSTPTLGFGNYEWDISSFDKSLNIKVIPKDSNSTE